MAFKTVPEIVDGNSGDTTFIFPERTSAPEYGNPYYNTPSVGGYNPCIIGNVPQGASSSNRTGTPGMNVLPNCVGYATGRFNEIGNWGSCKYLGNTNAEMFWAMYSAKLGRSSEPSLGACIVWQSGLSPTSSSEEVDTDEYGVYGPGHVAIVEKINTDGSIVVSQSGWSGSAFWRATHYKGSDGNWIEGDDYNWMTKSFLGRRVPKYKFLGFIRNPAVQGVLVTTGGPIDWREYQQQNTEPANTVVYEKKEVEVTTLGYRTAEENLQRTTSTNLLTYPSLVETPFIILTVGNYTFGSYVRKDSKEYGDVISRVQYPNYMDSLNVVKINGTVNQYTIQMTYAIEAGNDPNLLDKIFSTVSETRRVKLSYGDWSNPKFIYKEEEAIITGINSSVDFGHAQIRYTITCTSSALNLMGNTWQFPAYANAKPSTILFDTLYDGKYGLLDIFYGMKDKAVVISKGWIPTDDKAIRIEAKQMDPLSYLNYLVSCMCSNTNTSDSPIRDSSYYMSLFDDIYGEDSGPYFKITKIKSNSKTISQANVYDIDVGFPGQTLVQNFSIKNNDSWSILYNYSNKINQQDYVYKIDNKGDIYQEYSPNITTSSTYFVATEPQKSWWTKVTQFPISAELTIKGLVRAATLMTYVRVNAFFYGQRHISSGLYVITRQEDSVSSAGYRTRLTLLRVGGDEDYIVSSTQTVSIYGPTVYAENSTEIKTDSATGTQYNAYGIVDDNLGEYTPYDQWGGGGGHGGGAGRGR